MLLRDADGYCDPTVKQCVISSFEEEMGLPGCKKNLWVHQEKVIRHELVHAFLYESGLSENSWAGNEEIVDWIAAQFPKLDGAFVAAMEGLEQEERQRHEGELFGR
ncbi:MAG: hypothetical protein IKQ96_00335 [Lachnospiraceae bacterium]|nr:hypothetical protein [Lachnospiraceae bacterium]